MLHADLLAERARLTPEREALLELSSGRRFSYGELDARVDRLLAALVAGLGLSRGERLAVLAGNRLEYVELFFAAARGGLVLVHLNTHWTPAELSPLLVDSGARALLFDAAQRDKVAALEAPALVHRVCFDAPVTAGPVTAGPASFAKLLQETRIGAAPRVAPAPEEVCALIYTSGTTGQPKGVMLSQRMFGWNAYNTVVGWQLRDDDVTSVFTPLYHAAGFGVFLLPLFAIGGRVVLHEGFDADEVLQTIERERCTVLLGVPTIFSRLAEHPAFSDAAWGSLRWAISGGAPLPRHLIDRYGELGVVLKQGFGMTEAGVNCFTMTSDEATKKAGSIGRPLPFTEARVVDDSGVAARADQVGHLQLRGPHLFSGYWNNPTPEAVFTADGFFDTGDLARVDAEGYFFIAGREKDMFISGGVNIYPAEIEAALLAHPGVGDAAVLGVADERWGEAGVAFVVVREASLTTATLRTHLASRLARYKIPRQLHLVDELPRTEYGKVRKDVLRQKHATMQPPVASAGQLGGEDHD